jgi:hypothetical protein
MTRISVLFIIVVVTISSLCIVDGDLLGVDVLEEATILHFVIGFGMKLAGTLQGLVVVILVIGVSTWLLNHIDFMIVLTGTLASVVIVAVTPPIMIVSVVTVLVAPITMIVVVIPTTVIVVIIAARWVFGA